MKLLRIAPYAAALCLASFVTAQTTKAPEKSAEAQQAELAVREQAKKFYDLLVAGKARAAEALVCEASKDEYYSMDKRNPRSAEVRAVTVSDDLKSAVAVVWVEDEFPLGFGKKLVKMPLPSDWKVEGGQWCYYMPPNTEELETPFGKIKLKAQEKGASGESQGELAPIPVSPEKLSRMVSFSKHDLALPFGADGKDEIVVSNGLNGPIQFRVGCPDVPGLACKMDQPYVSAGKQGKLLVDFKFKGTPIREPVAVTIWVLPFDSATTFPIHAATLTPKP
jgi:hypothetical protein